MSESVSDAGLGFVHNPLGREVKTFQSKDRYVVEVGGAFIVSKIDDNNFRVTDPENGRKYEIKIAEVDEWMIGEKDDSRGQERESVEKDLSTRIATSIYHKMHAELRKASSFDQEMGETVIDTIERSDDEIKSELWLDALNEARKYMESLMDKKIKLKNIKYEIGDGRVIEILTIGDIRSTTVGRALQVMDEYVTTLGVARILSLKIINFFDFEEHEGTERGVTYSQASCAREMFNSAGLADYSSDTIQITPIAHTDLEHNTKLDLVYYYRILRHELAHRMDKWAKRATSAQREGFARMCELRFSFENAKRDMRKTYTNEVTKSGLLKTLDLDEKTSGSVKKELYDVTGSFFSFLIDRYGAERFMHFYGLITGASAYDEGRVVDYDALAKKSLLDEAKNNTREALRLSYRDRLPDEILDSYLSEINAK